MKRLFNKLALSNALVLVVGVSFVGLSYAAGPGKLTNTAKICPPLEISDLPSVEDLLRRTDIRWAQTELRFKGFYHGSLDGTLGRETKEAIRRFQKDRSLGQTATLDAQTWAALTGEPGIGEGSSVAAVTDRTAAIANSPLASGLGR